MNKYCSKCDEIYFDNNYNYCPICSSELEEVDDQYLEIKYLISRVNFLDENLFKVDEEKEVVKFKWNSEWLSIPILAIIEEEKIIYTPPQPNFFELVTTIKDKWDKQLKNDLPDYNKKLTFSQVKHCEGIIRISREQGSKVRPRFVASVNIKELLQDLKGHRIHDFEEIRKNGLYLILIKE